MKIDSKYKYNAIVDFKAPILPGIGLGNLRLDYPLNFLKDWIVYNFFSENRDNISVEVFNGIYLNYTIGNGIELIINAMDAKIERIGCKPGYEGSFNDIKPGATIHEVIKPDMDAYINNDMIFLKEYPGIEIDIPASFEDIEVFSELSNFVIERIYVVPLSN